MKIIKKLPKIYQNEIDKKIKNNREAYYSLSNHDNKTKTIESSDVDLVIDGIFSGFHHAFNIPVLIHTNNKDYDTYLIARTSDYVLTIDHDRIRIPEILSIKRKNP